MTPRLLRPRKAAEYLDLNVDYFNKHVRPGLTEIRVGLRGIRFDVQELDAWVDDYKLENGVQPTEKQPRFDHNKVMRYAQSNGLKTSFYEQARKEWKKKNPRK